MTKAHHLIRYFVVRELPRIGKPTPPELIFDCRGPMSTTRRFRLSRLITCLYAGFVEVFFPLHRQELFFVGVAGFAAGHHVTPGAFATARNRDDVIHGHRFGRGCPPAVVTFTSCHPAFPPLGLPKLPGPPAFSL